MKYNEATYLKAETELKSRQENAEKLAAARKKELSVKFPELIEIENEIKNSVLCAVKSIGSGKVIDISAIAQKNLDAQQKKRNLLKEAGYPEDYLDPQYTCRLCGDTGYFEGRLCECHLKLLKQLSAEELSCNSVLSSCTFANFDISLYSDKKDLSYGFSPKAAAAAYCEMLKSFCINFPAQKQSFVLRGGTGLGKTHLALSVMNALNERNFGVYYGSMPRVAKELEKEQFGRSNDNIEEDIFNSDLIILDDFGTEFETTFTKAAVFDLINNIILTGKPVIICTNLTFDELKNRYGDRVVSRLNSFEILNFIGADIRQIKK